MSNDTEQSLSEAYDLIEADKLQEARAIIEPILEQDSQNADAWWLYIHAVEDADKARDGLNTLRQIDPGYPGLIDLSEQLGATQPSQSTSSIKSLSPPKRLSDAAVQQQADDILSSLDDDFDDLDDDFGDSQRTPSDPVDNFGMDDDFGDFGDIDAEFASETDGTVSEQTNSRRTPLLIGGAILALIILVLLAFLLFNQDGGDDGEETETPTQIAQADLTEESEEPTELSEISDPELSATAIIEQLTLDVEATRAQQNMLQTEAAIGEGEVTSSPVDPTQQPDTAPGEQGTEADTSATEEDEAGLDPAQQTATVLVEGTTATAQQATNAAEQEDASATSEISETPIPTEQVDAGVDLQTALEQFELFGSGIENRNSSLGNVFLVAVCTMPGSALRDTLDDVMAVLAEQSENIEGTFDAVGARLVNCEEERTLNTIAVPLPETIAFKNGEITERDFRGLWQPIN